MLTPQEKRRIRAEEIYRNTCRNELENQNVNVCGKINRFLNSALGIWLLSTIVIGTGSWAFNFYTTQQKEEAVKQEKVERLSTEIESRVSQFRNSIMSYGGKFDTLTSGQNNTLDTYNIKRYLNFYQKVDNEELVDEVVQNLPKKEVSLSGNVILSHAYYAYLDGKSAPMLTNDPIVFPEFRGRGIYSLVVEKRNLVSGEERKQVEKFLLDIERINQIIFNSKIDKANDFLRASEVIRDLINKNLPVRESSASDTSTDQYLEAYRMLLKKHSKDAGQTSMPQSLNLSPTPSNEPQVKLKQH